MAPRPPGPSGLSAESITLAALALVDTQGVAALTMRRLGQALGVEAMALYRYFPSRRDLLDALVERLVLDTGGDPGLELQADDDWTDYLHRIAHHVREIALSHPRAFPLVATHPTAAPWVRPPLRSLRWVDSFLGGLLEHHFPPPAAVTVYKQFAGFLLGSLLLEVASLGLDHAEDATAPGTSTGDPDRDQARENRADHAEAVERELPNGPTGQEIEKAAQSRVTSTVDEPSVVAAEPQLLAAAAAAGVAGDDDSAAAVAEVDIPIVAAVVSTASLDLSGYPNVRDLAGLLARDTALEDFDRQLSALIEAFAALRRS